MFVWNCRKSRVPVYVRVRACCDSAAGNNHVRHPRSKRELGMAAGWGWLGEGADPCFACAHDEPSEQQHSYLRWDKIPRSLATRGSTFHTPLNVYSESIDNHLRQRSWHLWLHMPQLLLLHILKMYCDVGLNKKKKKNLLCTVCFPVRLNSI